MTIFYYSIKPRYTEGSPGTARSRATAEAIAQDERDFYQSALAGDWGEFWKQRAEMLGLSRIVELHAVYGTHIDVEDLITGKRYRIDRRSVPAVETELPTHANTVGARA